MVPVGSLEAFLEILDLDLLCRFLLSEVCVSSVSVSSSSSSSSSATARRAADAALRVKTLG